MLPKCQCPHCNNVGVHAVPLMNRGGRMGYICDYHLTAKLYASNNDEYGIAKSHGFTIGTELETSSTTPKARIELMNKGFIPTEDCTVDVEYKSPIMHGLNALSKHCVTWEKLIKSGDMTIGRECGTHLHIGCRGRIDWDVMACLREYAKQLFIPLSKAMQSNPEATEQLFGRYFHRQWAYPYTDYSYSDDRYHFINLTNSNTIEFRLCFFRDAKQYQKVAKFCVDAVACILKNFIDHYCEEPKDKRRYKTMEQYRAHKAETTANKLVALFEKYTNC